MESQPPCASSESDQLINLPLGDSVHCAAAVLFQPPIDVLSGGGAVGLLSPHPTPTRHQCRNWGAVGEQNAGSVCQFNLSAGGGDLIDFHGSGGELRSL